MFNKNNAKYTAVYLMNPFNLYSDHVSLWLYRSIEVDVWDFNLARSPTVITLKQSNPITGLDRPWGFQEVEAPRFQDNRHMKVVRLSALSTGRLYPPRNIPGTHFCWRLSQTQSHSAARRIINKKKSSDTIENRTRDLPAYSAVPQPTAPLGTPK